MVNAKHTKFILTPIFEILKDCVNATKGIGIGIETYPLCEYIMQTTFLKMTGASEQKLKCILWEIATNDFHFRYEFLKTSYGECSKKLFDTSHFCNYACDKQGNENISLIENSIVFEHIVYDQRNRCAHNLRSYQNNLPDFKILVSNEYDYENYFFRFSILVLLDEIFMKMYSEYFELLTVNI